MITHLTKPDDESLKTHDESEINLNAVENLIKILEDEKICGSTTKRGFIIGNTLAVCFQEAPLYGLIQNVQYEHKMR